MHHVANYETWCNTYRPGLLCNSTEFIAISVEPVSFSLCTGVLCFYVCLVTLRELDVSVCM
jgi:hypothetical protein